VGDHSPPRFAGPQDKTGGRWAPERRRPRAVPTGGDYFLAGSFFALCLGLERQ
jgi:hypothetical protein